MKRVLATWGNGDFGRLGHGNALVELIPKMVSLKDAIIAKVTCGSAHTVALGDDGSVYTCGLNTAGQLGHSQNQDYVMDFKEVLLPEASIGIAAGNEHTLMLTESGDIWSVGKNQFGQLGLGKSHKDSHLPHRISALAGAKATQIKACMNHSIALLASGEVLTWGSGNNGQLGHGDSAFPKDRDEFVPRQISSLKEHKIGHIATGFLHSGCIDEFSNVWMWGDNRYFQSGATQNPQFSDPIQIGLSSIQELSLNGNHSMGLRRNGNLMVWGANENGVLGLGNEGPLTSREPVQLPNLYFSQVASGWKHCMAIKSDGRMFAWGWGGSEGSSSVLSPQQSSGGQLGLGNEFDFWQPTEVHHLQCDDQILKSSPDETDMKYWRAHQVSCGLTHTAAIVDTFEE